VITVGDRLDLNRVREVRAVEPGRIRELYAARSRRGMLGVDGRLMIVAADHPARGALSVRGESMAMADRGDLLRRIVVALSNPGVDGVLGTPDILDDLLVLGALEGKLAFGSMNRGGIQGSAFELDDRFTGHDVERIVDRALDGGKMLCRIDLADPATAATLESCGRAISALADHRLPAMIEPFLSHRQNGRVVNDLTAPAVVRSVTIASGLGADSAYTWLKLPVVDGLEEVMAATTLPTLLLGGDPSGAPEETYGKWEHALTLPGVRGLVIGRALLFPPDGDVASAVDTAVRLVHRDTGDTGDTGDAEAIA
jgi:hypothetical protein